MPHLAPHVCDANVFASPTAPEARTDGRSTYRQRSSAVSGLMMSRTTRHVGQSQQSLVMVNSISHPIVTAHAHE